MLAGREATAASKMPGAGLIFGGDVISSKSERLGFWATTLAAVIGMAIAAGVAYGVIGADVRRNSIDIIELRKREISLGIIITDIRMAQVGALTQLEALNDRMGTVTRILEQQYGSPSPAQ